MSGETQIFDDAEIQETMTKIASDNKNMSSTTVEKAAVESKTKQKDEHALSQSLLETFEMEDDDQFENLLDDITL